MAALSSPTAWPAGTHRPAAWAQRTSAANRAHGSHGAQGTQGTHDAHGPLAEPTSRASGASVERAAARRACAFVFIANLPHLAEAYGQDFASAASLEVQRRLCAGFTSLPSSDMARLRDDCFLVWANEAFECGPFGIHEAGKASGASRRASRSPASPNRSHGSRRARTAG